MGSRLPAADQLLLPTRGDGVGPPAWGSCLQARGSLRSVSVRRIADDRSDGHTSRYTRCCVICRVRPIDGLMGLFDVAVKPVEPGLARAGRLRVVLLLAPVACWLVVVDFYRRDHHEVGFLGHGKVVAPWMGAVVITGACGYLAVRGGLEGACRVTGRRPLSQGATTEQLWWPRQQP